MVVSNTSLSYLHCMYVDHELFEEAFSTQALHIRDHDDWKSRIRECCANVLSKYAQLDAGELYCPPVWDGWQCWNFTAAGTTAYSQCPEFTHHGYVNREGETGRAFRECREDGSWFINPRSNQSWSDYSLCKSPPNHLERAPLYLYLAGYALSFIFCLAAFVLLTTLKTLKGNRITIHKNLFLSYVFASLVWIFYYSLFLDGHIPQDNPLWCQVAHVLTKYVTAANFMWMWCEGFYLHSMLVCVFSAGKPLLVVCFAVGWGLPLFLCAIYAGIRSQYADETEMCWISPSPRHLTWIVHAFVIASLVVSVVFLGNIVRVLVTKLSASNNPDDNQTRKAARATLILVPLLGCQYFMFMVAPSEKSSAHHVYSTVLALVTSLQGTVVSLIFCFFNGEVLASLRRRYQMWSLLRGGVSSGRQSFCVTEDPGMQTEETSHMPLERGSVVQTSLVGKDIVSERIPLNTTNSVIDK